MIIQPMDVRLAKASTRRALRVECELKTLLRRKPIRVRWEVLFAILEGQIGVRSQQPRGTKYDKDWNKEHEQKIIRLVVIFGME